jgi:hypothetical protein
VGLGHLILFYATLGCFCGPLIIESFRHYLIIFGIRYMSQICSYSFVKFFFVEGWISLMVCHLLGWRNSTIFRSFLFIYSGFGWGVLGCSIFLLSKRFQ